MIARRAVIASLAVLPGACVVNWLNERADLVRVYDLEREAALHPDGPPFLALYRRSFYQLGWVAAEHSPTPDTPTAAVIRGAFERIDPRAVILEGIPTAWGPDPERVLRRVAELLPDLGDEGDVAVRLAVACGAELWGGEPTDAELAARLLARGFAAEDIFYTAFFGPLEQDARGGSFTSPSDPGFDVSFERWASILIAGYGELATATPDAFRVWFQTRFGVSIENDPEWYARGWPGREGPSSDIARASNRERDVHAYRVTLARLRTHERVVVVFGGSHLSSVWSALEGSLGAPQIVRLP